mmetsp:Transcript_12546/g.29963  ORF Transcript_12546/g.29963 Transcript_12546/m.29963 type:complete len:208 (-) Transcript_12546:18-641(-)
MISPTPLHPPMIFAQSSVWATSSFLLLDIPMVPASSFALLTVQQLSLASNEPSASVAFLQTKKTTMQSPSQMMLKKNTHHTITILACIFHPIGTLRDSHILASCTAVLLVSTMKSSLNFNADKVAPTSFLINVAHSNGLKPKMTLSLLSLTKILVSASLKNANTLNEFVFCSQTKTRTHASLLRMQLLLPLQYLPKLEHGLPNTDNT